MPEEAAHPKSGDRGQLPGIPHYIDRISAENIWKDSLNNEKRLFQEARDRAPGPAPYGINLINAQRNGLLTDIKMSHNRLEIITENVEKGTPQERNDTSGIDPNAFDNNAIRHTLKKPIEKYDIPVTRAQEIGWLIAAKHNARSVQKVGLTKRYPEAEALGLTSPPKKSMAKSSSDSSLATSTKVNPHLPKAEKDDPRLKELNNKRFYKPKTFCAITKYADNYVSTMHHDPFNKALAGR
mmetsp:Transcript_82553/g.145684  ORF Transcript_82553/g.145684 Transcript_82553/m.145684 type:complete len:239 (-) Transcript_82553:128-844(-)|eukprot:CAMPEP_0197662274 /NCGR_PEP_ID=MMETSP1338-20131121/52750_1 /TAXON_ID=43686 ORGANISM="Pelagodinium beii, Strain RCC1491" /NCGR_SAMPLE_ID=MMETSP1338 /ASSEMBLY_ACC=CAM_ASM_000754 /LENGTH=238 /DNA_ID=CAMNT_0043240043 /DNA_START=75 /DNA_END=791 /DNA_ORIENTATION=+